MKEIKVFCRGHATLYLAVSVCTSIGNKYFLNCKQLLHYGLYLTICNSLTVNPALFFVKGGFSLLSDSLWRDVTVLELVFWESVNAFSIFVHFEFILLWKNFRPIKICDQIFSNFAVLKSLGWNRLLSAFSLSRDPNLYSFVIF